MSNAHASLAEIGFKAADEIVADPALAGHAAYVVTGRADGSLSVDRYRYAPGTGGHPDVEVTYCGDSYDAVVCGEQVSGDLHTLRAVLGRRLARLAARNPANA